MLTELDPATRALVRLAAAIAGGTDGVMRSAIDGCVGTADATAVEEIILQSYLFAGLPRTLNAMRTWRSQSGRAPEAYGTPDDAVAKWRESGERTCAAVYGDAYDRLRDNIRALHPALDEWMIVEGYGKVLSRPGVELKVRELAVVAACAANRQQRQLHSHLHGALNTGATAGEVDATLRALDDLIPPLALEGYRDLLKKVVASRFHAG